ncbi:MAG: hypothetical protein LQ350_004936 [Teloschistes chrysophthalmus]|nr:MAG: hypothetical protein LQ350_004936 [Niorma chrysophthalma]
MDQPPTADPLETFTLLPLSISPTSKALTSPLPHLSPALTSLSALQRTLLSTPSQTPPPPIPTNPKRSAQIQKMREQGNAALRKTSSSSSASSNNKDGGSGNGNSTAQEAITLYTYALEMALGRPGWEPSSLVREEASTLYANRAQAYMAAGMWAEGAADAGASVECKRVGNGKAWWRRGKFDNFLLRPVLPIPWLIQAMLARQLARWSY